MDGEDYEVVWNGGPLLPERDEHWDSRFKVMPNLDLDENDEAPAPVKESRRYVPSGKFKGIFSRTNPTAKQYKPTGPGGQLNQSGGEDIDKG